MRPITLEAELKGVGANYLELIVADNEVPPPGVKSTPTRLPVSREVVEAVVESGLLFTRIKMTIEGTYAPTLTMRPSAQRWRSMNDAPKDGTCVLLMQSAVYGLDARQDIGFWDSFALLWRARDDGRELWTPGLQGWMPLE